MVKYVVGFCEECCELTKQKVVQCEDSTFFQVFEAICTIGLSLAFFKRDYFCECTKCGEINIVNK